MALNFHTKEQTIKNDTPDIGVVTLYCEMNFVNPLLHGQLLKTLWEKKKRAISSFPTIFSTQSDNCIPICLYF